MSKNSEFRDLLAKYELRVNSEMKKKKVRDMLMDRLRVEENLRLGISLDSTDVGAIWYSDSYDAAFEQLYSSHKRNGHDLDEFYSLVKEKRLKIIAAG